MDEYEVFSQLVIIMMYGIRYALPNCGILLQPTICMSSEDHIIRCTHSFQTKGTSRLNFLVQFARWHKNPYPERAAFYSVERVGGGGGPSDPPAVRPLRDFELRGKNERAALNERKPMVPKFKVSGQPMTSEVRSNTRSGPCLTRLSSGRY